MPDPHLEEILEKFQISLRLIHRKFVKFLENAQVKYPDTNYIK
jgi:hypothetical protein